MGGMGLRRGPKFGLGATVLAPKSQVESPRETSRSKRDFIAKGHVEHFSKRNEKEK
jgi:hypothetical protein